MVSTTTRSLASSLLLALAIAACTQPAGAPSASTPASAPSAAASEPAPSASADASPSASGGGGPDDYGSDDYSQPGG